MNSALIASLGYVRIASCAPRVAVADVSANVEEIKRVATEVHKQGADIALFPELCLCGYTCGDVLRQPTLLNAVHSGLELLRAHSVNQHLLIVVSAPLEWGGKLYNVAIAINDGQFLAAVPKTFLPNSREYYDQRWFSSGAGIRNQCLKIAGQEVPFGIDLLVCDTARASVVLGMEVCEDLWSVEPPSGLMAKSGATVVLNCSASNEIVGKSEYRRALVSMQSARTYTVYAYSSAGPTESTTDVVFGGHCMLAECGEIIAQSDRFALDGSYVIADVDIDRCTRERLQSTSFAQEQQDLSFRRIYTHVPSSVKATIQRRIDTMPFVPQYDADRALRCQEILTIQATGLAVRFKRSGASRLVLGLSGGLDSTLAALVCMKACDILGLPHETVLAVSMPGMGTTERTRSNADALATALGMAFKTVPIETSVLQHFADIGHDPHDTSVVYENAQARERTQILMDLANMHRGIVVGTGDLSEIALGWSTYNADHMSMYNPNAGVPKTLVQHLIAWYAESSSEQVAVVLRDILDTPISPELLPKSADGAIEHKTEDILGPYEVHDFFLYRFVRLQESVRTIAIVASVAFAPRYSPAQITAWLRVFLTRFIVNQFKRSSMPDGVKVGSVALSPRADWRMPSDMSTSLWLAELDSIAAEIVEI
ncbi:MAG: NAD(+) synthase [Ignavibacteria bacterium]|nr:NAD(+) synthase [Ignavibacteria bacterium]